jgi:hypothetical protein
MRLGLLTIVGAIAALSEVASAQNKPVYKSLNATDFLVDANDLMGKRVTVTDCGFRGASTSFVMCLPPKGGGYFYIMSDSLERESLRRALKTCVGHSVNPKQCRGSVTGVVSRLGSAGPSLKDATIEWAPEVATPQNKPVVKTTLDATDYIVDAPDLIGKRVTVTGCSFESADSYFVVCRTRNIAGRNSIFINSDSLERESLRRALKTCTASTPNAQCRGSVTGIVSPALRTPTLKDATIEWAQ